MVGLATAYRLTKRGEDVVVFERDDVVGGLAASFQPVAGGDRLERFYHHVFRSDRRFIELVRELGLADRLVWRKPGASCFVGGEMHALDGVGSLLRFAPLPPTQRLRLAVALGILKASPSASPFEGRQGARWLRQVGGNGAYATVFGPLFRSNSVRTRNRSRCRGFGPASTTAPRRWDIRSGAFRRSTNVSPSASWSKAARCASRRPSPPSSRKHTGFACEPPRRRTANVSTAW